MAYRAPGLAPESQVPQHRRGTVGGRFCRVCCGVYPRHAARHVGKPIFGKDHVSAPCSQEGLAFDAGADWWEPAVEMRPEIVDESSGDVAADGADDTATS